MNLPPKPQRKPTQVDNRPNGAVPGPNANIYNRKAASESDANKSTLKRPSSGLNASNVPTNRNDSSPQPYTGPMKVSHDTKMKGVD